MSESSLSGDTRSAVPPFDDWASDLASERENVGLDAYAAKIAWLLRVAYTDGREAGGLEITELRHSVACRTDELQRTQDAHAIEVTHLQGKVAEAEALLTQRTNERDELMERLSEKLFPMEGRCDKGHHPKFGYDLSTLHGPKGCMVCDLDAARAEFAALHREQAALVEQLIVELREIAEGFRAADAETLLSFLDSFERRLTKLAVPPARTS